MYPLTSFQPDEGTFYDRQSPWRRTYFRAHGGILPVGRRFVVSALAPTQKRVAPVSGMVRPADAPGMDDVIEALGYDRREDVRLVINLLGRYVLASRRNLRGDRREFACRIVNISLRGMALAAPVPGPLGERVIVYSEQLGRLHGAITRLMSNGFAMSIAAGPETREKLVAKLDWLARQRDAPDLRDGRRHPRIVPCNPMATILTADGSIRSCLVIDFSESGAAVSADLCPVKGTPLAVGNIIGRVVRCFAEGFAIQFVEQVSIGEIERRLRAPITGSSNASKLAAIARKWSSAL
jgi:hypothetical protein